MQTVAGRQAGVLYTNTQSAKSITPLFTDMGEFILNSTRALSDRGIKTMPENQVARNECSERIHSPGGFNWSDQDLASYANDTNASILKGDKRAPDFVEDIISLIAHKADTDCSGTVSKVEIEEFKSSTKNQASIDFADHLLANFDRISGFAKADWSEIKDTAARALVEKYFKDNAPDSVISAKDILSMKNSSPFSMSFAVAFDYEPERQKALNKAGLWGQIFGSKDLDAYNELAKQVNSRVELRSQILKLQ